LLDIRLAGADTLALVERLSRDHPELPVLLFAERASSEDAARAVASGANGLLLKTAPVADLLKALVDAAGGGVVIDQDLAPTGRLGAVLTSREIEVVRLLAGGLTNREISRALFISLATVRRHVESIRRKLGTSSRAAAVGEALRRGFVD
jgi:DNA-binding NarL/FixJ family response regulator